METKNFNGMKVLSQQTADEIIAWCEQDKYITGGRVNNVEKRISDGDIGYKDVSYKRWHFERYDTCFGLYIYWHIDIQQIMSDKYVAAIEVGAKREEDRDVIFPAIFRMYESIRGANDLRKLILLGWEVAKAGEAIIHRQRFFND